MAAKKKVSARTESDRNAEVTKLAKAIVDAHERGGLYTPHLIEAFLRAMGVVDPHANIRIRVT